MRGKAGFFRGRAVQRTLYFNGAVGDATWETLGNWWNDLSFTSPAESLPTADDEARVYGFVSSSGNQSVRSLVAGGGGIITNMTITVSGGAVFQSGSSLYTGSVLNGDATFNGNSANYGTVNGSATFNNTSSNYGTVTGTKTCNTSGAC